MPDPVLGPEGLIYIVSFILTVAMTGRYHYSHFTEGETEAQKGEKGMKVPSATKDRASVLAGSLCLQKAAMEGIPTLFWTSNKISYQKTRSTAMVVTSSHAQTGTANKSLRAYSSLRYGEL